jgi:hypothetical protein
MQAANQAASSAKVARSEVAAERTAAAASAAAAFGRGQAEAQADIHRLQVFTCIAVGYSSIVALPSTDYDDVFLASISATNLKTRLVQNDTLLLFEYGLQILRSTIYHPWLLPLVPVEGPDTTAASVQRTTIF